MKSDSIHNESLAEDDGFVENNLLNELDDTDPLVASDQMLPVLDSIDDDVDSLFDELERLLAPEGTDILQSINTVQSFSLLANQ